MTIIVRSLLVLILAGILISGAEAYIITIDAPDRAIRGSSLIVTGNTTFPEDTYFDLVLYYSKYTAGEVKRQRVIVDGSKEFRAGFETRDLEKGQYKIEVHSIFSDGKEYIESSLGSSSVIRRIVKVTDRSDEIIIESSRNQTFTGGLDITGKVKGTEAGVITLRVFGPDNFTFGPEQLITTAGYADKDGHFSSHIPVSLPGEYQISLSDKDGYIGEYTFSITDDRIKDEPTLTDTPTPRHTSLPSPPETLVASEPVKPEPSPTRSPLPAIVIIGGILGGYCLISQGREKRR